MQNQAINPCDMMAKAIVHIREEIERKERRIEEMEADLQVLKVQLEIDRSQLNAFEDEFAASCRA